MASVDREARLGEVLIQFSTDGKFPEEEETSAAHIQNSALPGALRALQDAQTALETEIRQISRDKAADVDTWIAHAQTIQDDIESSRRLASSIVQQAEAEEERLEALDEQELYVTFLENELAFSEHLAQSLQALQWLNDSLDVVEKLAEESNLLEALKMLEDVYKQTTSASADESTRAMKVLDDRCTELRETIHEQLDDVWKALVCLDPQSGSITISRNLPDQKMDLSQAILGLIAYKKLDKAAQQLWKELDEAIIKPRTIIRAGRVTGVIIEENTIKPGAESADYTITSLISDMTNIVRFLCANLPQEFIKHLSDAMMPTLSARVKELWLDSAVPTSLDDMQRYQKALIQVRDFANNLDEVNWPDTASFHDWVNAVPKIWLAKRRETSLDWIRNQLSLGIGVPKFAEKIEKRMVERDEGIHLANTGTVAPEDDWGAAWDSGDDIENAPESDTTAPPLKRHKNSLEEERLVFQTSSADPAEDEDDGADAWGWGDEDGDESTSAAVEPESSRVPTRQPVEPLIPNRREVTLSEKYWTSSMPQPVLQTVISIYEDGAALTRESNMQLPIAPAAPGLFNLPTSVLAMYRAISPYYYAPAENGNLYLYNDATWLSDRLQEFQEEWNQRKDLPDRSYGMVKLDPEIKTLQSFGKRAYTNELIAQRTTLKNFLGESQNFFQQDPSEIASQLEIVTHLIRDKASAWSRILSWSALASALGSLVNSVASKLITDIFDLPSIGVDEAERLATALSKIEALDDLFIKPVESPSLPNGKKLAVKKEEQISLAPHFVELWFRLNFLNQVLQSNLADIKFLWNESDLSLCFSADEVVELIGLSFENNHNVRMVIRDIQRNREPRRD